LLQTSSLKTITMKQISFRTTTALTLAVLLSACGAGQQEVQTTAQTASVQTAAVTTAAFEAASTGAPVAPVASANMPAPDCAADGCKSLRIIDGNAEAWRIDAQRRAALEGQYPQS
jgi:hypothetical protein